MGSLSPALGCMCLRSGGGSATWRRKARCSRIFRWPTISCSACRAGRAGLGVAWPSLLELVGLPGSFADRPPQALSGGEQQRVALARALAPTPRLVLLDEPFSALDAALRAETRTAVTAALAAADATAVLVTHDQAEALSMGHEVAVLREGRLVQVSDPVTLYRHPRDAALASFVGEVMVVRGEVRGARVTCALGELALASFTQDGPADVLVGPSRFGSMPIPRGPIRRGTWYRRRFARSPSMGTTPWWS